MPALSKIQNYWQQYLLHQQYDEAFTSAITAPRTGTIEDRIAIYAEAYKGRLVETLEKAYPYLKKFLGEDKFNVLAEAYIDAHPSQHFSLREFGQHLSQFSQEKLIRDIAALEWAIYTAIDAEDKTPLTIDALYAVPETEWHNIIFELHPSFVLLQFTTNALTIYQSLIQQQAAPTIETHQSQYCRIWRKDKQVYFLAVTEIETQFLQAIAREATFSEICEHLCHFMPETEVAVYVIQQLSRWINENILVGLSMKDIS